MLVNNSLMSPVSDLLQDPHLQISQGNSVWGGRGLSTPAAQQASGFEHCLLPSALFLNEPKAQTEIAFCAAMEGKHLSYSRHHWRLLISATALWPLLWYPADQPAQREGSGEHSLLRACSAPTLPSQIPLLLWTDPDCLLASRDKDMSSYTQYITLKSLQIIRCDASLGHYYSHFNISQSKFFWNIHRFRHSLKFVCNSKVPCLHVIPK